MRRKDGELLEDRRPWPFTVKRRERCVQRIMDETGIGKYEAEIAYRIATCGLSCKSGSEEANDGENGQGA